MKRPAAAVSGRDRARRQPANGSPPEDLQRKDIKTSVGPRFTHPDSLDNAFCLGPVYGLRVDAFGAAMVRSIQKNAAFAGSKAFLAKVAKVFNHERVLLQDNPAQFRRITVQASLRQVAQTPGRHGQEHH